jgi:hypothetical protein
MSLATVDDVCTLVSTLTLLEKMALTAVSRTDLPALTPVFVQMLTSSGGRGYGSGTAQQIRDAAPNTRPGD